MRICVVDDEREVRISIIQKLTEFCPHEEIFDVGFGLQALEQIPIIQPDLIFLDIRMPEMDGLELLQQLKTAYPFMHVVIISGFDDFEYARRALQYGAMDYMLKPADRRQLKANVERVKREHEVVFQQQFELLESKQHERVLRFKDLELYNLSLWFNERQWKTVLFQEESPTRLADCKQSPHQMMFTFKTAGGIEGAVVKSSLEDNEKGFMTKESCLPFLGEQIARMEQQIFFADKALTDNRRPDMIRNEAQQLRKRIFVQAVRGDSDGLAQTLTGWLDCLALLPLKELRRECAQLMAALESGMTRQEQEVLVLDEDTLYYWHNWVYHYRTWHELKHHIYRLVVGGVTALNELSQEKTETAGWSWFDQALKLMDNAKDAAMSLESVAEAVNVHPVTLSRMFKQQMGVTFVRYLTVKRLKLAQELLLTTDKRINDISDEAGYSDYRYFRTLFKKEFGCSPSEYRAKHGIEEADGEKP